uniref:Uncharacterized protein n=1 Tax=Anopheles albimanus TaxID=7167 RepID=A0A182FY55_ANOAL
GKSNRFSLTRSVLKLGSLRFQVREKEPKSRLANCGVLRGFEVACWR